MARIKLKVFLTLVGVGLACSMGGSSVAQDQPGVAGADGQLILGQAAAAAPAFDVEGHSIAKAKSAAAAAVSQIARFEVYNPSSASLKWRITVRFDPRTYPYKITSGSISGTICDSPKWRVTSGSIGSTLTINASHTGSGSCARTLRLTGSFHAPPSYRGTYGWNGASTSFRHHTLFLGYGP